MSAAYGRLPVVAIAMRPVGGWLSDRFHPIPVLTGGYAVVTALALIASLELALIPVGTVAFLGMAAARLGPLDRQDDPGVTAEVADLGGSRLRTDQDLVAVETNPNHGPLGRAVDPLGDDVSRCRRAEKSPGTIRDGVHVVTLAGPGQP
jgi:hypothetical protein